MAGSQAGVRNIGVWRLERACQVTEKRISGIASDGQTARRLSSVLDEFGATKVSMQTCTSHFYLTSQVLRGAFECAGRMKILCDGKLYSSGKCRRRETSFESKYEYPFRPKLATRRLTMCRDGCPCHHRYSRADIRIRRHSSRRFRMRAHSQSYQFRKT